MTTTLVYVLTSRVHKKSDNNDHIPFIRAISEKYIMNFFIANI